LRSVAFNFAVAVAMAGVFVLIFWAAQTGASPA
jgi:hypothetical protein